MNRTTRQFVTMFLTAAMFLNLMPALAEAAAKPLTVLSPDARGAELTAPVEVIVRVRNARPDRFRAELNGRDVTHLFGPLNGGTRQAVFTAAHLREGRNRFEARLGWHRAQRIFHVKSLEDGGGPPPGADQRALYVPIQTRVVSGDGAQASDYAIKVGEQTYTAPLLSGGGATGYQILLLDRRTLVPVSNVSVPMNSEDDTGWLSQAVNNRQQCGDYGCLAVVQSLQFAGWTPRCDPYQNPDCYKNSPITPGVIFGEIGGSDSPARIDYADGTTPHTGYSLIANVGPNGTPPRVRL